MTINYNTKGDLLYLRFDNTKHTVINKRVNDSIVIDIDENEKIIGIEILNASSNVDLEKLLPLEMESS